MPGDIHPTRRNYKLSGHKEVRRHKGKAQAKQRVRNEILKETQE